MFNVAIIGGENTNNYDNFRERCIFYLKNKAKSGCGITILTTGDEYVDKFAKRYGIDVKNYYTEWKRFGKDALKNRNQNICKNCDAMIYFDNGIKDQRMLYNMAVENSIPCRLISQ